MTPAQALRWAAAVLTLVLGLVIASLAPIATAGAMDDPAAATAPVTTIVAGEVPSSTVLDNPFLPEEANVGDCISALPRPGCGSEARGGWRQTLVFVALAGGLAVIAWRLIVAVRRRDRTTPTAP